MTHQVRYRSSTHTTSIPMHNINTSGDPPESSRAERPVVHKTSSSPSADGNRSGWIDPDRAWKFLSWIFGSWFSCSFLGTSSHKGLRSMEVRNAQLLHSLDGTKHHPDM